MGDWSPAPEEPGAALLTVEVDGQVFALRRGPGDSTHYDWLSGPDAGYGFTSSAPPDQPLDEHREAIRGFLAQVDPAAGHIGDD